MKQTGQNPKNTLFEMGLILWIEHLDALVRIAAMGSYVPDELNRWYSTMETYCF
jgi:hypothetical protein